ncbi:hypothetical protein Moror_11434 [Moniliophthora roreri MCA 2997]|uniref:Uncharacterized protein n=1 Tax=Moniliophthora roreri (strain MCA 2997) TaxID=1381753 RepID=V2WU82_MONRO|nr:hypothetical protein Moror_11434 [Moniliophthora roreri MCA 2997]
MPSTRAPLSLSLSLSIPHFWNLSGNLSRSNHEHGQSSGSLIRTHGTVLDSPFAHLSGAEGVFTSRYAIFLPSSYWKTGEGMSKKESESELRITCTSL